MRDSALLIVDMLNDFIDGSMACRNAKEAVNETVAFIDRETGTEEEEYDGNGIAGQFPILFICDHHPADHCSFMANGGLWPEHCVVWTRGSAVHDRLLPYAHEELTFLKGCDKEEEQYSGWAGRNKAGQTVAEVLDLLDIRNIYICGIATEFCVKATAEDAAASGRKVFLIEKALAYVDHDGHVRALEEMRKEGIDII